MSKNQSCPVIPQFSGGASTHPEISQLILAYRSAKILFTAVELNLFEHIQKGTRTIESLSRKLSINLRTCGALLNALVALKFLKKSSHEYFNTKTAERFLLKDSPESLFYNLSFQNSLFRAWADLTATVKSGKPHQGLLTLIKDKKITQDYILGMKEIAPVPAKEISKILSHPAPKKMLDVGAGPGTFSLMMLRNCPQLETVLLDLPSTLVHARKLLAKYSLNGRVKYEGSNYHQYYFKSNLYDLILMSHILHNEGEVEIRRLLKKAYIALQSGGRIAIHDFCLNKDGCSPVFSAVYSVYMTVLTNKGLTPKIDNFLKWLKETGFRNLKCHPICANNLNATMLITGVKP